MATAVSVRREGAGALLALAGLPGLTAALVQADAPYATPVLLVLVLVVAVALVGGLRPAVPAAVAGGLLLNYFFTQPLHELSVARSGDLVVLGAYLVVAVAVSAVVDLAARRTAEARRAAAEAEALSSVAGARLAEEETLPAVLTRVREVFSASQVLLLEGPVEVASVGQPGVADVEEVVPAGGSARLVVRGPALFAADRRVLQAFAEAAGTALTGRRMVEVDRLRTALLAAVGHDLRTPLAGVKAAVSSLRSDEVQWSPEESTELLQTIEESADRLQSLVTNLLDASRLEAGALSVAKAPVGLDEVVGRALVGMPDRERVSVDVDESHVVTTDAGLLERVVANLVDNALRHGGGEVEIVSAPGTLVISDHGAGLTELPPAFVSDRGTGLGLLVVQGFVQALGGTLSPSVTPGGGLTMTVVLP